MDVTSGSVVNCWVDVAIGSFCFVVVVVVLGCLEGWTVVETYWWYFWRSIMRSDVGGGGSYWCGSFIPTIKWNKIEEKWYF